MKKAIITLITIPAIAFGAAALADMKGHGGPFGDKDKSERCDREKGDRGERMLKRMSKKLDLTDEQKVAVGKLMEEKRDQKVASKDKMVELHKAIRDLDPTADNYTQQLNKAKQTAADMAMQRVDSKASMKAEMQKILTGEQLAKLDEMMEKMEKRHKRW